MKRNKKMVIAMLALAIAAGSGAVPMTVSAANAAGVVSEALGGYTYSVAGDTFDFYDHDNRITILGGVLKGGKDISYYGLNDDGDLATVYFNTQADEGKGVVITNDTMTYITYAGGAMTEVQRDIGTIELFGFDMSLADSSMEGMMKVFNASLGSFVQAYAGTLMDYSSLSSTGNHTGAVEYVKGSKTTLSLMDDNFITNLDGDADEAFLANEWGIYSGYQIVDDVDYNSFCFFGTNNDIYYYGYAKTESGYQVLTMKGTVSDVSDREKTVQLVPVDMTKTSDDASQYITKMASCLMGAQGHTSLNLDTLELKAHEGGKHHKNARIEVSTSTASGVLAYDAETDSYVGTIADENGNTEALSIQIKKNTFVVNAQTTGVFTIAKKGCKGSLAAANPAVQKPEKPEKPVKPGKPAEKPEKPVKPVKPGKPGEKPGKPGKK